MNIVHTLMNIGHNSGLADVGVEVTDCGKLRITNGLAGKGEWIGARQSRFKDDAGMADWTRIHRCERAPIAERTCLVYTRYTINMNAV